MIQFLSDDFTALNNYLKEAKPQLLLILVDENTHEHCLPQLLYNMETEIPFEIIEIEAGEESKNIETATQLWEIFTEFQADRHSLLINLGGGVITDLGGFVASTYKRGIQFVNVPTSLLAMVDASIGGKTGIDHQFYKNIVGTFTFPENIFVFPTFLETLNFEELRSGFAEMLKHGLIASVTHWNQLKQVQLHQKKLAPLIVDSMTIKQNIVAHDPKENSIRKTLNFGHTLGHAIESLFLQSNESIRHGEAVAAGMIMEAHISSSLNLLSMNELTEVWEVLQQFYPKLDLARYSFGQIYQLMLNDKKNASGVIKFSLIDKIGSCLYDVEATETQIKDAIAFYVAH